MKLSCPMIAMRLALRSHNKDRNLLSNYNWNVQPTNTIYQDSENCSHEKNKYHFNFARIGQRRFRIIIVAGPLRFLFFLFTHCVQNKKTRMFAIWSLFAIACDFRWKCCLFTPGGFQSSHLPYTLSRKLAHTMFDQRKKSEKKKETFDGISLSS